MVKIIALGVACALGGALFVYGGADDSPGAQLLGLVVVVAAIVGLVKLKLPSIG